MLDAVGICKLFICRQMYKSRTWSMHLKNQATWQLTDNQTVGMDNNKGEYLESSGATTGSYRLGSSSSGVGQSGVSEGLTSSMSMLSVTSSQGSAGASLSALGEAEEMTGSANEASHGAHQTSVPSAPPLNSTIVGMSSGSSGSTVGRTTLNPNAAEYVPKARTSGSSAVICNVLEATKPAEKVDVVTPNLNRTNSYSSNASDDEYRRFCRAQLPDDLMSDFDFRDFSENVADFEESSVDLSSGAGMSSGWARGGISGTVQGDRLIYDERVQQSALRVTSYSPPARSSSRYSVGQLREEGTTPSGPGLAQRLSASREMQAPWAESNESGSLFSDWGPEQSFADDLGEVDPVSLLAAEFPGFAAESLAEIYYANGGDLSLTMEMLTELELQAEGSPSKQFQAPSSPAPPSPMDFPALSSLETVNGTSLSSRANSLDGEARSVPDFAAVVRKQAAQQASQLQYERNGGVDLPVGAVRGLSQGSGGGGFSRDARVAHGERLDSYHLHRHEMHQQPQPTWLETGDSVASMYSDMREEARDHARVRNAYFEQARQAYLTGNKALAKELSAKGQWHNEQMKAAHSKAGEAIFWQRNSSAYVQNSSSPGHSLLDLHGLHVNEAIPRLKREIAALRSKVRTTRQREQMFICVGTGHHTKGARTPARLPTAVQRYLAEEEHLQFTETTAGMLRIIIR